MKPSGPSAADQDTIETYEYVIVGAGPAGLQLSYFLQRAGLRHLVVERAAAPGAFFATFPRHRKLISSNKVHTGIDDEETNLRWDWNSLLSDVGRRFTQITPRYFPAADDMVAYLAEFSREHNLPIEYNFDAARVDRDLAGSFRLLSHDGRVVLGQRLIIATGMSQPYVPSFPGAELCEPYTSVSVDPQDFVGQRVLILGKGNSAFETADNLVETTTSIHLLSPNPLKMAWRTHFVGHLRAVNNNILDTYHLKSQNALLDADVREIRREGSEYVVTVAYAHADGEVETLRYDRVIACTGFRFDPTMFSDDCRPELRINGRLPAMTSEWESSNVKGLFFAGMLMQYRDYKKYMSAFIHGFRYNVRALAKIFEQRYHGTPWPSRAVAGTAEDLTAALLARANRSSGLWQQPGFLGDVVRLGEGSSAEYLEELPVDLAKDSLFQRGQWLLLTLEFGAVQGDPFEVSRIHRADTRRAEQSTFLHPIVRHFVEGAMVSEHHVIEDLAAVWDEPEHHGPLQSFLVGALSGDEALANVAEAGQRIRSAIHLTKAAEVEETAKRDAKG